MHDLLDDLSVLSWALLVLGLLILASEGKTGRKYVRIFLCALSIVLAWRYIAWRFTSTLPEPGLTATFIISILFFFFEVVSTISVSGLFIMLCRKLDRSSEADENATWWEHRKPPRVAVFIPTYNEGLDVLERTIAGASAINYGNFRVYVLDDAKRGWLAEYCHKHKVGYITRPDNRHAKAGNINHAFRLLQSLKRPPEFIAILDADFIPHRDFVARAISLFHNRSVALVQTPQYFFNPDPIQHNLGITHDYPDEQRFFFNHVEPARDAWDIAACCGTSSLLRASALAEIGGFPTESVTEDFLVTLRLAEAGHRTVYLNEPLSQGLAAEGLGEYILQRGRWALGMMQIVRGPYNPLSLKHRLSLRQRLSVADSFLFWSCTFIWRLIGICIPLLYWYLGICPVQASVDDFLRYFVPSYLAASLTLNWISRGLFIPFIPDVAQLIAAPAVASAIFKGLFTKGPHKFNVTAKGLDRTTLTVQWPIMKPFALILALTIIGLSLPLFTDYAPTNNGGEEQAVMLFWSMYNLVVLSLAVIVCFERPRPCHTMRNPIAQVGISASGGYAPMWMKDLSIGGATFVGPVAVEAGQSIWVTMPHVGEVSATVVRVFKGGAAVTFHFTEVQRTSVIAMLHTDGASPGVVVGRVSGVALRLIRGMVS